jgi:exosortase/archaeosortase family protein
MVSPRFSIQIERGCDAVEPSALFVVAVLASPVRFRRKIPPVILGTVFLLVLNVIRIVTLFLTGLHLRSLFDTMHLDVWQAAFIVLAILLWAVWASRVARTRARQPDATA